MLKHVILRINLANPVYPFFLAMEKNKVRPFEPVFQTPPPLIHTGSKGPPPPELQWTAGLCAIWGTSCSLCILWGGGSQVLAVCVFVTSVHQESIALVAKEVFRIIRSDGEGFMLPYLNDLWVRDFMRRQGWIWRSTDTDCPPQYIS